MYITPVPSNSVDEEQRQQALPLLAASPVSVSALPTQQPPEVNPSATDHIIYDSEWISLPADKKTQLLGLLSANRSAIVVISTPDTTQAQLDAVLAEASGSPAVKAAKSVKLPNGTVSTLAVAPYHEAILPALLKAHDDNTQGFPESGLAGDYTVVARAPDGTPTAVEWVLSNPAGERVVTLLGYWRSRKSGAHNLLHAHRYGRARTHKRSPFRQPNAI